MRLPVFPVLVVLFGLLRVAVAEPPDPDTLVMEEWADVSMLQDPVAIAFDNRGRLFVAETARRGTVDIDIRAHRDWLLEDLANDDFESMRDFFRRRMATELSDQNKPWLPDHNADGVHDYRDLTTISERIRLLEDTDGDGQADRSTIYADGFDEEFTGVAAGVMPYDGDVLFTVYPDLWKLRDLDGDGRADGRVSLFRGFGVHAAFDGHDLHGLTVGPEGKIYFSCGDNGFSVTTKEGRRLHYPNTGGVLRMNADGSDLEVFAYGLRNVQEFDFDKYGNMFGVDNDGDLEDERERAVYIAEGSDSGWRLNWQFRSPGWAQYNGGLTYNPWTAEGMWKPQHKQQPAHITPPMQNYSVGPGGFKFNPGMGLNEAYEDFFFSVQFPVQKVTAFRTESRGAGFRMVDEHLFNGGLMVSSMNFGPDGGLYLADWIGKWQPNQQGVIYRVDDPSVAGSTARTELKKLLNEGVSRATVGQLTDYLGHSDRRIRQLAQFELVRRGRGYRMFQVASDSKAKQLARIHALWGLIQLRDPRQMRWLGNRLPWQDDDAQIRQQCARVAGELRLQGAADRLILQLQDDAALVRSHAALALRKIEAPQAVPALLDLLRSNADTDPFIRHAAVMGLVGCAAPKTLGAMCQDDSPAVRLGAVLALRRMRSSEIQRFLNDPDTRVLRETARGIHDDFTIPGALTGLAELLDAPSLPADEPTLRRIISANFQLGSQDCAERLVRFLATAASLPEQLSTDMWLEALNCLADWDRSPVVDRVVGRIRTSPRPAPDAGKIVLRAHLDAVFETAPPGLIDDATKITSQLGLPINTGLMEQLVQSESNDVYARVEALQVLHEQDAASLESMLRVGWESERWPLQQKALEILAMRDPPAAWRRMEWENVSLDQRQLQISLLPQLDMAEADEKLKSLLRSCNGPDDGTTLDVILAVQMRDPEWLKSNASLLDHPSGMFRFAERGGDAVRGAAIYRNHVSAQCVRCHEAGGMGKQAGPELRGIASRVDSRYLLEALVDPSAKLAKGFEGITLLLDDGEMISGTLIAEDGNRLIVGTPNGKQVEVHASQIELRKAADQSAMPKMTEVLSATEIRDVVAYLTTLK